MAEEKIILTVGLPRSGKSTWAKSTNFPIVNPDAVRLSVYGQRYWGPGESIVWSIVFIMADALLKAGNNTIIVDATNISQKRRDEWINKFPQCFIEMAVFEASPEECIARAKLTGQSDLIPVIQKMAKEWDLPMPGTWKNPV